MILGERPDWHRHANCREVGTEVMFPSDSFGVREALDVCNGCPVVAECLEFALVNNETDGIWGAKSERQRNKIRRRSGLHAIQMAESAPLTSMTPLPPPAGRCRARRHRSIVLQVSRPSGA